MSIRAQLSVVIVSATLCLVVAPLACSSKPANAPLKPSRSASVTMVEGQAGGKYEDSFTVSTIVRAVDVRTRQVTLEGSDGAKVTFTAPPEVRNLDQLRVGDHVRATIAEEVEISVREDGRASVTHTELSARAPKGAKPGAMAAERYEVVAEVTSIDPTKRRVRMKFVDGSTESVLVRDDVELNRYKVGDHVVIRVTDQLTVLVEDR